MIPANFEQDSEIFLAPGLSAVCMSCSPAACPGSSVRRSSASIGGWQATALECNELFAPFVATLFFRFRACLVLCSLRCQCTGALNFKSSEHAGSKPGTLQRWPGSVNYLPERLEAIIGRENGTLIYSSVPLANSPSALEALSFSFGCAVLSNCEVLCPYLCTNYIREVRSVEMN